jgi:protein involved in polysaccharide export with SLBB domain
MHKTYQIWLIGFFLALCGTVLNAQVDKNALQQQARAELQRRGVDEAAVRAKLLQRGIDIDNVQPEQLASLQPTIEAVIQEVEAEKAKAAPAAPSAAPTPEKTPAARPGAPTNAAAPGTLNTYEIQEKVKQGASVEEAISELAARPADSLPPAQVYGQHLFRNKSLAIFRTTNEVKPPDSYVLSAGDEITVSVFGASQFDSKFEINREGYIQPSGMPKVFLKGVRLGQARDLLRNRFGQFYRFAPEQFAVSLSTARSLTVNIFGETVNYGSFAISAVNTAFNALVAAGGPTDLGTVRNIKLIRGRSTRQLDLYEFMNNPGIQYDFFLEDNDIIHVPVAERVVGISGAINRPFRYELINGENLLKLLEYAGGLRANAYREIVQVRRFAADKQLLIDVNLADLVAKKQDFSLLNGDEVIVREIPSPMDNTASIEGAVELPGKYALRETPRVSDLLKKGLLRREARRDLAFLSRLNPNQTRRLVQLDLEAILANPGSAQDLPLQAQDQLVVYALARYTDRSSFSVRGAVRDTLSGVPFPSDSTITLQRALLLAGGLRSDANDMGYLVRSNPNNPKEKQYLSVDLMAALRDANSPQNLVLQPFDEVVALSRLAFTDAATVAVGGAVRSPGTFAYGRNMRLREAIVLAGGFRLEAALNRVDIFRVEIRENQPTRTIVNTIEVDNNFFAPGNASEKIELQPFDEVVVRTVPEFEFQQFVELQGELRYPGRYALISDNERLADLIRRAGGLSEEAFPEGATLLRNAGQRGYVVTNLPEALRQRSSPHNHILKEGDVVTVPKREDLVGISIANTRAAEAYRQDFLPSGRINVAYRAGRRAGWYIREYAAGFDKKNAAKTKVTVVHPNGKISRTVNLGLFKIYPKVKKGTLIAVGGKQPKPEKPEKEKKSVDWDKRLTQILATVSTLATVALAVSALR